LSQVYRVADYIADFIVHYGVNHAFLLPGGGSMHLVDAFGKAETIQCIPTLHEQAASIAAEAYSRISNKPGVAIVTTGPGATNAITGVAGAWIESVPLIIISGQVKTADMLNDSPLRQNGVQEVDIVKVVKSITKYAVTVRGPEDICDVMNKAILQAVSGRAGPVWIDIPLDIQGAPIERFKKSDLKLNLDENYSDISAKKLEHLVALIQASERPLFLAGHGIRLAGGAEIFKNLIEKLNIPVVTTWNALDLLPYDHPLNIGRPGVVALRAPNFAIQNSDLLISIGSRLDNIITAYDPKRFAPKAKKIIVDIDQNEINKLDMNIEISFNNDAKYFLENLDHQTQINSNNWANWKKSCQSWKSRYSVNDGKDFPIKGEISHYHFVDTLSDKIPPNIIVSTGSSGLGIEAFYTVYRNREGQRLFLTSGLGSMGYGLPAAIGACFANQKKPMILVEGDGSLQLNIQEMSTIASHDLPICIVLINNKGYASIRNTQRNYFDGRYVGTDQDSGLLLPDIKKIASTYNFDYLKIKDASELSEKLDSAMVKRWPLIIDVHVKNNEILTPKVAAMPKADGSILSMPLEDMSPLLPQEVLEKEMIIGISDTSIEARKNLENK